MTVLVLAPDFDVSADRVVLALGERDVPVFRVDTAWFPTGISLDAELRDGRWTGRLRTPHRGVELEELRSVWYRGPTAYRFPANLSPAERQHAFMEAKFGLGGVLASLDVLWVNHPNRAAAAYKPLQLATAARCGLSVPDTLVTNEPAAVRRFATGAATVTKMLGANHIGEEGIRKLTFTRLLGDGELADLRGIEVTAHQFQRWAPKQAEARIVVIGERQCGFAIHAGSDAAYVDFRADYDALRYEPIDVPPHVGEGITRFMAAMGLVYGALDFVVGPDGTFTFLEANPGGQFGFLEANTGVPLTSTLADFLAKGAPR